MGKKKKCAPKPFSIILIILGVLGIIISSLGHGPTFPYLFNPLFYALIVFEGVYCLNLISLKTAKIVTLFLLIIAAVIEIRYLFIQNDVESAVVFALTPLLIAAYLILYIHST